VGGRGSDSRWLGTYHDAGPWRRQFELGLSRTHHYNNEEGFGGSVVGHDVSQKVSTRVWREEEKVR
jgi:hypothetical protein